MNEKNISCKEVAHFDESGVRVNGRTVWLHVASTAKRMFHIIHLKVAGGFRAMGGSEVPMP